MFSGQLVLGVMSKLISYWENFVDTFYWKHIKYTTSPSRFYSTELF